MLKIFLYLNRKRPLARRTLTCFLLPSCDCLYRAKMQLERAERLLLIAIPSLKRAISLVLSCLLLCLSLPIIAPGGKVEEFSVLSFH